MDENHANVRVEVRVVDYGDRNEDGEPLQVSHGQEFTRDRLERQSPREFAETVVSMGASAVYRRLREGVERPGDPLSSFCPRLKFDHGPAVRLLNGPTDTTIRYDPEGEHDYSEGTELELVYAPTGDVFARARVVAADSGVKASDALHYARSYPASSLKELLDSLNRYYEDPLDHSTEVTVLVLDVLETYDDEVDL